MLIYSSTINSFLKRIKARSMKIMSSEMGLATRRSRISWNGYTIPLNFVIFEDPNKHGYFDYRFYQIGLNKNLLYTSKDEVLDNIIRHELAHFYCYLIYGNQIKAHGQEYREACLNFGWGKEVYAATANIETENAQSIVGEQSEKVVSRIQKLLGLASSSNKFEAQAATLKANQLLLKHNIQLLENTDQKFHQEDEEVFVKRVFEGKKLTASARAISEILKYFYVSPVINRGVKTTFLEAVGSKVNVEMADYVAKFLLQEFEYQWVKAKKENPKKLVGLKSKNSFIIGMGQGFAQKLELEKSNISDTEKYALIKVEENTKRMMNIAYPKLSNAIYTSSEDKFASRLGGEKGKNLSIKKAIKEGPLGKLLSF